MGFNVCLPFVKEIYSDVQSGDVDGCIAWLSEYLRERETSAMHCVLDRNFDHFLQEYSEWFFGIVEKAGEKALTPPLVFSASMGEFEINMPNWMTYMAIYQGFAGVGSPADVYTFLAETRRIGVPSFFRFTGLEPLWEAFEQDFQAGKGDDDDDDDFELDDDDEDMDDEIELDEDEALEDDEDEDDEDRQLRDEVSTAATYLVYLYFLRLNRLTHELAATRNHPLAQSHVMSYYGDLAWHSAPLQ